MLMTHDNFRIGVACNHVPVGKITEHITQEIILIK